MSLITDILSSILTRGRKIQVKMGLKKDFDDSKLDVGEFGLILDEDELRIGLADGTTKKVGGLDISELPNASTTTKGIVQLNDTFTSISTTEAPTARTVKELKELIDNIGNASEGGLTLADIPVASVTQDGLMPKAMVAKLNGISSGANFVQVTDSVTSTSTTQAASANAVKQAYDLANTANNKPSGGDVKSDGTIPMNTLTVGTRSTNSEIGIYSFTQGNKMTASGLCSHAIGFESSATGAYAYAEGLRNVASGSYSHAEGCDTVANYSGAHAQGLRTTASGLCSHAQGTDTVARYENSHASGIGTITPSHASHAQGVYNKPMEQQGSYLATNTSFVIGNGTSDSSRSNAFRVTFDGKTYGQSAFNTTGADYAEYFEWQDLNPNNEDRVGYFVTLNGEKIEIANSNSDYIIGVISANPSVIGDSYQDQWQGMYVTDKWGRIQNEYVDVKYEVFDEAGNKTIKTRKNYVHKLNPNYDTESEYIPREKRKEWSPVGMLGKLLVRDNGTCEVNGYAKVADGGIATKSDSKEGYRVIKRIDDDIVQIIFK